MRKAFIALGAVAALAGGGAAANAADTPHTGKLHCATQRARFEHARDAVALTKPGTEARQRAEAARRAAQEDLRKCLRREDGKDRK
jgi:hypothetical protein